MKFQNKLVIKPTNVKLSVYNVQYILHKVLGQLPQTKIALNPNSNSNPKPNPNPNRGAIFLVGNWKDTIRDDILK